VHATLRPAGALVKVNEFACSIGGELEWLSKNRLSDNADTVKHFWSALRHALGEERHFALVE